MAEDRLSGKLRVILHADVAGSTWLVQQNQQIAHQRIQDAFRSFSKTIEQYQGRVLEVRGDALLAEFERASDAVAATIAFQKDQTHRNSGIKDDLKPNLRAGIAIGEVIIADDTVTGEGVVLAQRIEQLADPGGLCITAAIHEALPKRMPFDHQNLGEQTLKGFDETIRVYSVELSENQSIPEPHQDSKTDPAPKSSNLILVIVAVVLILVGGSIYWSRAQISQSGTETVEIVSYEKSTPAIKEQPSIAVLPFANMSGDPQQDYFADGITEDLTTDLSRISGLFVVARNSSFSYKGQSIDVRTIAQELGVRYILEGSVRRSNQQIRINAQLVDGISGGHIWAERFDGVMADVFSLQDHVNRKIVKALEVSLTDDDQARLNKVETSSPEAYDRLLRGFEQFQIFSREANAQARELFRQATVLDPGYARAYANVALTYTSDVTFNWSSDRSQSIQSGLEYAKMALELDDSIPQIYQTRSVLYLSQSRYDAAIEAAQRTIEVHPTYADGHATLAFILSYSGQPERALEAMLPAWKINPQGTNVYLGFEGHILFLLGRYQEAVEALEESIERNPAFDRVHLILAATYVELGRIDDAIWAVEEALVISPNITLEKERRDSNYKLQSDVEHYLEALRQAGVPAR